MAIRGIGMSFSAPSTTRPILSLNPRFLSASSTIPLFLVPSRSSYLLLSFSFSRPETECPVPHEQQPINEYQSLSTSFPFSWAAGDVVEYASRLFVTGASFALLLGLPVAWFGSAGAQAEPAKRLLCAASSGLFAVTLAVVRMYLGWAYVGNRLLSATVEYEETGWYDGQIWVKTAEVLARDRLLGSFFVKPVLGRLKITLVSLATSLLVCALILINIDGDQNLTSKEPRVRVVPGVYNDDSARLFEPDAFRDELDLQ
ncbi:hypothetical protein JHK82_039296 [Glycine max]|uniref:DUF1230 family protein n=2 Tax=Glycine subgen. Soja TaxID=1462606 RepID=I1M917_SOYBN|nr:uncharacterized protein ycf36 [Glycine max]XP_028201417.1 uncharacterized protein ycf36 [Glycine soja]KAG5110073.1 hypothetical protein JHK82_039296 [Glycine max]KAG5121359.1 hypothetical protein JHK84_039699 [Glycine max]KAH1212362.1 Protein CONSERVED IN THE GREEN LINEAGE AND DIATOMS 27, chloroplastic [Glycine max]KRH15526.1 hypothetical protein GLYMA_14G094200v4 [Glycine max]RZB68305.1 Protein CONSERVED IN THE GREEN LINEAGE AND DIATOMS 27, chloroplastic [Glycine soja]|eukprot:XP_003544530.1 uncharacterized protein ycf36 [Glycine max]